MLFCSWPYKLVEYNNSNTIIIVSENEYKFKMHFKQSDKIPPLAIKRYMHNLTIN